MLASLRNWLRNLFAIAAVGVLLAACLSTGPTLIPGSSGPSGVPQPTPPTISGAPATSASTGHAYAFTPAASAAGGKALSFAIANKPAWASFSTSTGALAGTPTTTDVGTFANVAITVSDGARTASLAPFTITVRPGTVGSATLSWLPPTQRTDGTALMNLAGYRIYYGNTPGNYPSTITVANPGLSTYVIDNLPSGTYYFVASAYDAVGNESSYSTPASKTIT